MSKIKIANLNPKAWGLKLMFKVVKKGESREVEFKDGSTHKVAEHLVGDNTGTILLTAWDDKIDKFEKGKVYEITEARMNVYNYRMKINMTRKSEMKEVDDDMKVKKTVNMSEKFFEKPKTWKRRRS